MESSSTGGRRKGTKRKTKDTGKSRKIQNKKLRGSKASKAAKTNILKIKTFRKDKSIVPHTRAKHGGLKKNDVNPQVTTEINCTDNVPQSTETITDTQSNPLHNNRVIKQEPLVDDNISNLDILVPKIEIEISDNEINTDFTNETESVERLGFKCPFCTITTQYKSAFQRHLRLAYVKMYEITSNKDNELGNTQYSCSYCKTNFSNTIIYQHHMKTHKSVSCEVCNFMYSYECELVKHQYLKNHNMNCFQCYLCNDCFNTENLLKEHLLSYHETSDIKLMCMLCKEIFSTKSEMLNHNTIVFKNQIDNNLDCGIFRPFKLDCNPCDAVSCSKDSFMIQIGVKKLSKFFCISCDNQYSNTYYLNQHFLTSHPNNVIQYANLINAQTSDTLVSSNSNESGSNTFNIENNTTSEQNITDIDQVFIKVEKEDISNQINLETSNHSLDSEFIVPDIKSEFILPFSNDESDIIIPSSTDSSIRKEKTNSLIKKKIKVKTIQLKVNNTTSQICSVNIKTNSTITPVNVNKRLANFFETNVNNMHDTERKILTDTISVAPVRHHKKTPDTYWCNACQCSVSSDHIHSDLKSETFKCHKCNRVFSSYVAIKRHFKSLHLKRTNFKATNNIDKPKRKPRVKKIQYHSTPRQFANPCAESTLSILQKNCIPKQNAKNSYHEHYFLYCSLCDTIYNKYEVYADHFSIHDLKKPFFKCIICDKMFANFKISLMHFKQHNETKINCSKCCKDINFNVYFDEHIKTCLSKKCSFCPNEMENNDAFHIHSLRHTIEANKVLECKICGGYFFTQYNFNMHFRYYHQIVLK